MKRSLIILLIIIGMIVPVKTYARENDIYFTTLNGAKLSEKQYNNLSRVFDEDNIYTMDNSTINLYKDNEELTKIETTKYIRTENYYDYHGNIVYSTEEEVTEADAVEYIKNKNMGMQSRTDTHETNMKKLTISLTMGSPSVKTVVVKNTWLDIPTIKSYDVIAFANGTGPSITINSISGYQKWDGNIISYNSSSDNIKTANSGAGISMNIKDEVTTSLENSMTVTFVNNATTYTAYGTYQHATSNVTLSESKNYSFSLNGMGGVLDFASSVENKYDDMRGVSITKIFGLY